MNYPQKQLLDGLWNPKPLININAECENLTATVKELEVDVKDLRSDFNCLDEIVNTIDGDQLESDIQDAQNQADNTAIDVEDIENRVCYIEDELEQFELKLKEHGKLLKKIVKAVNDHFDKDRYETINMTDEGEDKDE